VQQPVCQMRRGPRTAGTRPRGAAVAVATSARGTVGQEVHSASVADTAPLHRHSSGGASGPTARNAPVPAEPAADSVGGKTFECRRAPHPVAKLFPDCCRGPFHRMPTPGQGAVSASP
jgi:hypothetical protein